MGKIINEANIYMLLIAILAFLFFTIGSIKSFEMLCDHYNSKPNYKTLFTKKQCINYFIPLNCSIPTGDVSKCYEIKPINYSPIWE